MSTREKGKQCQLARRAIDWIVFLAAVAVFNLYMRSIAHDTATAEPPIVTVAAPGAGR